MKHIDKLYHFIVGAVIFWVANLFISYAIFPVILAALCKEIYDLRFKRSYMCGWDILATIAGGLLVWVVM